MYDVAVVGAGPAGASAALNLGRACRSVVLLDAGEGRNATAQGVQGLPVGSGLSPQHYRDATESTLSRLPEVRPVNQWVSKVDGEAERFQLLLEDGSVIQARRVLLATGLYHVLPDIPGLRRLWGSAVLHRPYCDGYELRGQPLAVLVQEASDTALALMLARFSSDVVCCVADEEMVPDQERTRLDKAGVTLKAAELTRVEAREDRIEHLVFSDGSQLRCSALFLHPESRQRSDLAANLGCEFLDDGAVAVDDLQRTSMSGIFAAGDMARRRTMPQPTHHVAIAVGEGVTAALALDCELAETDFC